MEISLPIALKHIADMEIENFVVARYVNLSQCQKLTQRAAFLVKNKIDIFREIWQFYIMYMGNLFGNGKTKAQHLDCITSSDDQCILRITDVILVSG